MFYFKIVFRQIVLCETAVNEIIDTLKKHLRESDQTLLSTEEPNYYNCIYANDQKYRGQRCLECLACNYYNFLTQYTQKNSDALIQCMY